MKIQITNQLLLVPALVLTPLGFQLWGQTSIADVNSQTPPAKVAALAWNAVFTSCPASATESFFSVFGGIPTEADHTLTIGARSYWLLVEYQGTFSPLQQSALSAADKANGVEWRGNQYLNVTIYREYIKGTLPWTEWKDGTPQANPVMEMERVKGGWSVRLNQRRSFSAQLLKAGIFTNPEELDNKISCSAAASSSPLAAYIDDLKPRSGQMFCAGTVLLDYERGIRTTLSAPARIDYTGDATGFGHMRFYLTGDHSRAGYGLIRGHPVDACSGSNVSVATQVQRYVCPGITLRNGNRSHVVTVPTKVVRDWPHKPNIPVGEIFVQVEGDTFAYPIREDLVKESCASGGQQQ
jgi:hypothetical protein